MQPPLLCERWDARPPCLSGDSSVLMDLHWFCYCTASSEQYSAHRFSISHSFVRHFPERSWMVVAFPCFKGSQVFHKMVYPLAVVLSQTFFNLTTVFSYPVFFCLFHAPLDVFVHFLVFLISFISEAIRCG